MNPACLGLELILIGARLCLPIGTQPEPPKTVYVTVCSKITPRAAQWQKELADERTGSGVQLRTDEMMSEWLSLRDQARACQARRR